MGYLIIGGLKVLPVGAEVRLSEQALHWVTPIFGRSSAKILSRYVKSGRIAYRLDSKLYVDMGTSYAIRAEWVKLVEPILNLEAINVKSD